MESRTRLAIGGMATVAASVTVICVVALTNSLALTESAGSPLNAAPVIVPASDSEESASATATPVPTPSATPVATPVDTAVETPTTPSTSAPAAEVVPAPEAKVVTPARPAPAPSATDTFEAAIAQAKAAGSLEPLRAWAQRRGWSTERIDALLAKLDRQLGDRSGTDGGSHSDGRGGSTTNSGKDDRGSGTDSSGERSANAGANADRWSERPGDGEKKTRWRDSPERRDR